MQSQGSDGDLRYDLNTAYLQLILQCSSSTTRSMVHLNQIHGKDRWRSAISATFVGDAEDNRESSISAVAS